MQKGEKRGKRRSKKRGKERRKRNKRAGGERRREEECEKTVKNRYRPGKLMEEGRKREG